MSTFLNDELSNIKLFNRILANFTVFSCLNVLTSLSSTRYMEPSVGTLEVAVEKDKGKKIGKTP